MAQAEPNQTRERHHHPAMRAVRKNDVYRLSNGLKAYQNEETRGLHLLGPVMKYCARADTRSGGDARELAWHPRCRHIDSAPWRQVS